MRICVLASGSRGDVQPAVALAARLAARGGDVKLVAPANFAALAAGRGFAFHPIDVDIEAELHSPSARRFFDGGGIGAFLRWSREVTAQYADIIADAVAEGGRDADLVVATGLMDGLGGALAEARGAPCVHAFFSPMLAAADFLFTADARPPPKLPGFLNRAMYRAFEQVFWLAVRQGQRRARARLGLGPPRVLAPLPGAIARGEPVLLAYSGALLPRSREWPGNVETTGWWFLDEDADWTPSEALERFLAAGPPPVYVGFGSMAFLDPEATARTVLEALEKAGARAVLSAGWGGLRTNDLPDGVFPLGAAPHDKLFPRMAAVVHHGGAGTTAAALRAGKPSVVTPFIVDQFPWARLLHARGLASAPLPHRALNADALAQAISTALSDDGMAARAADMGARLRAEDGAGRAAEIVERAAERVTR